ncbi:family 15 carbohydrate-binding domain-containing protein [Marinimicrobium sp. ABcell2]|uniref:family 15 carbohydrate-binding domain-containing protein n=1 Tax=Marinimicrobium sp. ABcell2 TaxID=3069751 RepID=UPI0027B2E48A|nr:family 15 carbohydrate-binding domain-containing protein [Marinimicrobium sp. ABcell2]MDQ2077693.1 family 15 carbohydrate-binding domain-containing protein [Marinimicrobium sp. ABcell2]
MLQKLLIALFAVSLLSACSGSSSSSSETVRDLPPPPAVEDECVPPAPEVVNYNFDSQEAVDEWFMNGDGQNVVLDYVDAEGAMSMTPIHWDTAEENWRRQARVALVEDPEEESVDMSGVTVRVDLYVPGEYLEDDGWGMQLIIQGEGYADNGWTGSADLEAGDNTITWNVGAAAGATHFGIQISNIPSNQTMEPILVKRVRMTFPVEDDCPDDEPQGETRFRAAMESGWRIEGDGEFEYTEDGVLWSPAAAGEQLVYDVEGQINWAGATLTVSFFVDQDFIDSGAALQPIAQQTYGSWAWHDCWIDSSDISAVEAGETIVFECGPLPGGFDLTEHAPGDEEAAGVKFGMQPNGGSGGGTVTVTRMVVDLADGVYLPELPTSITASLEEGWRTEGEGNAFEYVDDGILWTPAAGGQQMVYDVEGVQNYAGATLSIRFFVDQAFVDSGAALQPIAQLTYSSWAWHDCWIDGSAIADAGAGEVISFDCGPLPSGFDMNAVDPDEDHAPGIKFGMQPNGAPEGTVTITRLRVNMADGVYVQR